MKKEIANLLNQTREMADHAFYIGFVSGFIGGSVSVGVVLGGWIYFLP